jgi:hypothetical protein
MKKLFAIIKFFIKNNIEYRKVIKNKSLTENEESAKIVDDR